MLVCLLGLGGVVGGDLIENHAISLGTVVGVAAIVLPTAWWLGAKFKEIDDRDKRAEENLKQSKAELAADIQDIKDRLTTLPCIHDECRIQPKEPRESD